MKDKDKLHRITLTDGQQGAHGGYWRMQFGKQKSLQINA